MNLICFILLWVRKLKKVSERLCRLKTFVKWKIKNMFCICWDSVNNCDINHRFTCFVSDLCDLWDKTKSQTSSDYNKAKLFRKTLTCKYTTLHSKERIRLECPLIYWTKRGILHHDVLNIRLNLRVEIWDWAWAWQFRFHMIALRYKISYFKNVSQRLTLRSFCVKFSLAGPLIGNVTLTQRKDG